MNSKSKKGHIVFLEDSLSWGGVQKWILSLATGLKGCGWDVTIAAGPEGELAKRASRALIGVFPVKLNGRLGIFNPFQLRRFIAYLKKNKITTLFLNGSKEFKFGSLAAYFAKTPNVIYRRGAALPVAGRWYNRFFVRNVVSYIVTNSKASKNCILREGKNWLDNDKLRVIYNSVDLEVFTPDGEIAPVRKEFDIPEGHIIMTCIGRLTRQKGYNFVLEAVSHICRLSNDFHLLIIGEGQLENELKQIVKNKGMEKIVSFAGFRSDIPSVLRASDFLLHTPLWEGAPNVILEAMACEKPVVSWKASGIPELVENGVTGYLSEKEDIKELIGNIKRIFDDIYSSKAKQMGQVARNRAKEYFSQQKMLDEYVKILK